MASRLRMSGPASQSQGYEREISAWRSSVSWWRRFSSKVGLQGKLVLSFSLLLTLTLAASCWMYVSQSREKLADILGEQAKQMASVLALAGEDGLRQQRWDELMRIGQDLIKSRNILFVGILDADYKPVVLASRDIDFTESHLSSHAADTRGLMQVVPRSSPTFGNYVEVFSPVLSSPGRGRADDASPQRLLGYVAVGLSHSREEAQLRSINLLVLGIGCIGLMLSIPLGYVLVHRIFAPIRELVEATGKITGGDLNTQVAIHRPDIIGDLARSFNGMVLWVKQQQQDLAAANEKLAEANRDLENRITQRTSQLETANKRLATEIAEKEDFLRAVSHDLNAPLRNIAGMATMLLMKHRNSFDEDVIHRLERIKKNVDVQTDLIAELLELSRIKTRRQKMETVDLSALVNELRGVFENDLKSRGISLIVDSPLPAINCERARMRQVFQNLVDNAIKYMGDGPVRKIHVGCAVRVTEAEFYVRDTGIGIDPEDLDKVFHVFRRGKNTQAGTIAGKGVGLASVKSIIETYSGSIWVESAPGKGTTFRFTINGKFVPLAEKYINEGVKQKVA
jgi:signal transduction histidine kinase